MEASTEPAGALSWRLSSHPITLLCFLAFRLSSLLVYLFGFIFTDNFILIFILTLLLASLDFYYLKNIAGRRLVGLRWWNEVDAAGTGSATAAPGDSHWVFESAEPGTKVVNATDKRFFWLALYVVPVAWIALAIMALVRLRFVWGGLVAIALSLTITNALAFSRCDRFGQASHMAGHAWTGGGLAGNLASNVIGRFLNRG